MAALASCFVMHSRSVSVCGPFSVSFLKAVSIAARCSGVTLSCHSFGIGGMPLIWCVDVISHSPGLTSSLSAASASGATHQQPSRTIRVHRVFIERLPVMRSWAGLWRKSSRNAAPARRVPLRGYPQAFHLPPQARFHQDCRAERHAPGEAFEAAALRDPEARRTPAALRPAPGARRRLQVLGRNARPFAHSARQATRSRSGGPSARLRRLRRHDTERTVRRRHSAAVGSRLLAACSATFRPKRNCARAS